MLNHHLGDHTDIKKLMITSVLIFLAIATSVSAFTGGFTINNETIYEWPYFSTGIQIGNTTIYSGAESHHPIAGQWGLFQGSSKYCDPPGLYFPDWVDCNTIDACYDGWYGCESGYHLCCYSEGDYTCAPNGYSCNTRFYCRGRDIYCKSDHPKGICCSNEYGCCAPSTDPACCNGNVLCCNSGLIPRPNCNGCWEPGSECDWMYNPCPSGYVCDTQARKCIIEKIAVRVQVYESELDNDGNAIPIQGVLVDIGGNKRSTNVSGETHFMLVPGTYALLATKPGFEPITQTFTLGSSSQDIIVLMKKLCKIGYHECSENNLMVCNNTGYWEIEEMCEFGCAKDRCMECKPGTYTCKIINEMEVMSVCKSNGTWELIQVCEIACYNGACVGCIEGEKKLFTCPDETEVNWCTCSGGTMQCIISPETQCNNWCYDNDDCPTGYECLENQCKSKASSSTPIIIGAVVLITASGFGIYLFRNHRIILRRFK